MPHVEKMNHLGLDHSHTLVMKGLEDSAADSLEELTHHVVPQDVVMCNSLICTQSPRKKYKYVTC